MWRVKVQILLLLAILFGAVAQFWLERQIVDLKVEGSSPFGPAKYTPVAQSEFRAPCYERGGSWFEANREY